MIPRQCRPRRIRCRIDGGTVSCERAGMDVVDHTQDMHRSLCRILFVSMFVPLIASCSAEEAWIPTAAPYPPPMATLEPAYPRPAPWRSVAPSVATATTEPVKLAQMPSTKTPVLTDTPKPTKTPRRMATTPTLTPSATIDWSRPVSASMTLAEAKSEVLSWFDPARDPRIEWARYGYGQELWHVAPTRSVFPDFVGGEPFGEVTRIGKDPLCQH